MKPSAKSKLRTLFTSVALVTLSAFGQPAATAPHTFTIEGDHFVLGGRPFKILSGELDYARIPRECWHARLKMARAMGLNTIVSGLANPILDRPVIDTSIAAKQE